MSTSPTPGLAELLAHTRWVEELARSMVRDPAVAEDLAQSTLLAALEQRTQRHGDLRGWLSKVLRNQVREHWRRESARPRVESSGARAEALPPADELVERAECERRVVAAVLALEEPHRETLLLRYFEGLSPEEIARRSNMPLASVTSRITRAHARLRARLERDGSDASWMRALAPIVLRTAPETKAPGPAAATAPLSGFLVMLATLKLVAVVAVVALLLWWWWPQTERSPQIVTNEPKTAVENPAAPQVPSTDPSSAPSIEQRELVDAAPAATEPAGESSAAAATPTAAEPPRGGRIFGQIFRPDGTVAAKRRIRMLLMGKGPEKFAVTDERGKFDERELDPGVWALSTWPDATELATLGETPAKTLDGMTHMTQRTVDLERGAEIEVTLGAPPVAGVRAHGRVLSDGVATDGYMTWVPDGRDSMDRQRLATATAAEGYAVVLDDPGRYLVIVIQSEVRAEFAVDVPGAPDFAHDFELPTAALRGRITLADGSPVIGARADLTPRAAHSPRHPASSIMFSRTSDAEGRFTFRCLQPALYALGVHGGKVGADKAAATAIALRDVRVASGDGGEELTIVVATGSRARGTVHAESGKISGTSVFVFADDGEPLNPLDGVTADKSGAFETFALAPGHYLAVGACGDRWSDPVRFTVPADGEIDPLRLELKPAAMLTIDIRGREPAWVDVRDVNACCFSSLLDKRVFDRSVNRDWSTTAFTFRVPAGSYDIRVVAAEGLAASARIDAIPGTAGLVDLRR